MIAGKSKSRIAFIPILQWNNYCASETRITAAWSRSTWSTRSNDQESFTMIQFWTLEMYHAWHSILIDKMFQRKIFAWKIYEKEYTRGTEKRKNFFVTFRAANLGVRKRRTVVKIISLGLQCGRHYSRRKNNSAGHLSRRARGSSGKKSDWITSSKEGTQETAFFTVTKNSVSKKMIQCHRIALLSSREQKLKTEKIGKSTTQRRTMAFEGFHRRLCSSSKRRSRRELETSD